MFNFKSLTGLRCFLAFYIFVYHYMGCSDIYSVFALNGRIAVTTFFVLSGVVLSLA